MLAGCVSSQEWIERDTKQILALASYELDCPKAKLTLTSLDTSKLAVENKRYSRKYGVKGCGQRAIYLYSSQSGWTPSSKLAQDKTQVR